MALKMNITEKKYKCPYCLHEFTKSKAIKELNDKKKPIYKCPNNRICGRRLPLDFFNSASVVISIVGGASVGKTNFVIVLNQILKYGNLLGSMGISGHPDEESMDAVSEMSEKILKGDILDTTKKEHGVEKKSLCFQINIDKVKQTNQETFLSSILENGHFNFMKFVRESTKRIKHVHLFGNRSKTIYFSFFDNPGEGFGKASFINDEMNIRYSDAVIFLIAPEQIKGLVDETGGKAGISTNTTDLLIVIDNIIKSFNPDEDDMDSEKNRHFLTLIKRWASSILPKKRIGIPFASCLSKFDLLSDTIGSKIAFPCDESDEGFKALGIMSGTNVQPERIDEIIEKNHHDIYEMVTNNGGRSPINRMNEYFSNYRLFAMQSIHVEEDDKGNQKAGMSPHGMSFPLIWILKQLKLL